MEQFCFFHGFDEDSSSRSKARRWVTYYQTQLQLHYLAKYIKNGKSAFRIQKSDFLMLNFFLPAGSSRSFSGFGLESRMCGLILPLDGAEHFGTERNGITKLKTKNVFSGDFSDF
jgi:hypothetical protein